MLDRAHVRSFLSLRDGLTHLFKSVTLLLYLSYYDTLSGPPHKIEA